MKSATLTHLQPAAQRARAAYVTGVLLLSALTAILAPLPLLGQEERPDPVARLGEVLPPEVAAQVMARVQAALDRDLPAQAMANLALEGVAKGRSPEAVLAALDGLAGDLSRAQEALQARGGQPASSEVEAAAMAMQMGVDAEAVRTLAQAGPSGRSMAVPLMVLGGLAEQGLERGQALERVRTRLMAGAGDEEIMGELPEYARMRMAFRAGDAGAGMGMGDGPGVGAVPGQGPMTGIAVPVGPPTEVGPPSGLPGRGPRGGPAGSGGS